MEKMFKHNFHLTFLDSERNCLAPSAVQTCDAIIRLINTPLRMSRGIGMQACRMVTDTLLVVMT